jgi:glycosyltransferase involved in cell wall biosynthesis
VFLPFSESLERLGINKNSQKLAKTFLPLVMDLELFSSSPELAWPNYVKQIRSNSEFVVFSPSRIIDEINPTRIRVGSWKNTSALVYGFKLFLDSCDLTAHGLSNPKLVFIDRSYSPDVKKIKDLVQKLYLEGNVVWLKAVNESGFTRSQLRDLYSACDVVADDFGVGWFGGVALEGLAFNKEVITYVPDDLMISIYGSNPFNVCRTPIEIAQQLSRLFETKATNPPNSSGREWLQKVQGAEAILRKFDLLIDEMLT